MKSTGWRFLKVIYFLAILISIPLVILAWNLNIDNRFYSYLVKCNNGKTFDPTSKPIESLPQGANMPKYFNNAQINSECKTGKAGSSIITSDQNYFVTSGHNQNYSIETTYTHYDDTIKGTILILLTYFITIEAIRRTFLYIFTGVNFITLKK